MKAICHTEPRGLNSLEGFNGGDLYPIKINKIGRKIRVTIYTSEIVECRDTYTVSLITFNRYFKIVT